MENMNITNLETLRARMQELKAERDDLLVAVQENPQDNFSQQGLARVNAEILRISNLLGGPSMEPEDSPFAR